MIKQFKDRIDELRKMMVEMPHIHGFGWRGRLNESMIRTNEDLINGVETYKREVEREG